MSRRFRAYRKDASHVGVVAAFRAHGCSVLTVHESATGAPDLVVGFVGRDSMVEVKPTKEQAKAGKTWKRDTAPRPAQVKFHASWRGAPVAVVRTVEDVAALVATWRAAQSLAVDAAVALKEKLALRAEMLAEKAFADGLRWPEWTTEQKSGRFIGIPRHREADYAAAQTAATASPCDVRLEVHGTGGVNLETRPTGFKDAGAFERVETLQPGAEKPDQIKRKAQ